MYVAIVIFCSSKMACKAFYKSPTFIDLNLVIQSQADWLRGTPNFYAVSQDSVRSASRDIEDRSSTTLYICSIAFLLIERIRSPVLTKTLLPAWTPFSNVFRFLRHLATIYVKFCTRKQGPANQLNRNSQRGFTVPGTIDMSIMLHRAGWTIWLSSKPAKTNADWHNAWCNTL